MSNNKYLLLGNKRLNNLGGIVTGFPLFEPKLYLKREIKRGIGNTSGPIIGSLIGGPLGAVVGELLVE